MRMLRLALLLLIAAVSATAYAVVTTSTRSTEITGTGGTVFTVPFPFADAPSLVVTKVTIATSAETLLVLNTDYTVTLPVGSVSGKVTTVGSVSSLFRLRIERVTPLTQTTSLGSQGAFYPQIHERAFDKLTMAIQDNGGGGGGGSGVTDGDKGDVVISSSGSIYTIDPVVATTAGRDLMDDPSAASQRATLGLGSLATQSGTFSGTHSGTASGTNTGDQTITLTGDATGSGAGSFAVTIAADAVTNGKLANMAVNTVKCRITSGTGDPEDCTAANIRTIISAVSGSSSAFLDGTGSFSAPSAALAGFKVPVRVATTANITLSGAQTIDGVSVVAGNRVLVKNQSTASQNGIYDAASGSWTRSTDMDGAGEAAGALVYVQEGTVGADTAWSVTTNETITIGSTSISWAQFGSGGSVTFSNVNAALATANANIDINSFRIVNAGGPSGANDVATKTYVDGLTLGLPWKYSVKVATTANSTLSGTQTIDGVSVFNAERVLVKNQSTASQNGIYVCQSGTWARDIDFDSNLGTSAIGSAVYVSQGTANADTVWAVTNDLILTDTTSLVFAQLDQKAIIAGTGLTRSTNTLSVNTSQNITTLSGLTSNGFVKTSGGTGALSIDTGNYITGNQTITLSSDVTGSGTTAITATIANDAVTNAKAANMATATFKGRTTAGTGDPEDLTVTQATAMLNNAVGDSGSGGTKGLVPAAGAGDTAAGKFLRADMTYAVPAGGGGLSDGDKGDITVGSSGTTLTIDNDVVTYAKMQNVSATDKVLGRSTSGSGDVEEIAMTAAGRALVDDADAAAQRVTLGVSTLWLKQFAADMFLPVEAWTGSVHSAVTAALEFANQVNTRAFDQTTAEGVGLELVLPTGAANINLIIDQAAKTSGFTSSNGIQWTLCCRPKYGTGNFVCVDGAALTMTDNATIQRKTQTWTLSGLSLSAGTVAICELARDVADSDDTLTRDIVVTDAIFSVDP